VSPRTQHSPELNVGIAPGLKFVLLRVGIAVGTTVFGAAVGDVGATEGALVGSSMIGILQRREDKHSHAHANSSPCVQSVQLPPATQHLPGLIVGGSVNKEGLSVYFETALLGVGVGPAPVSGGA
jgi:hypothetical protein